MNQLLELDCPECLGNYHLTLEDIAKHRTVTCSGGHTFTLEDDNGDLTEVHKAYEDLKNTLKPFQRDIRPVGRESQSNLSHQAVTDSVRLSPRCSLRNPRDLRASHAC